MPTVYLNGHDTEACMQDRQLSVSRIDRSKDDVVTAKVPLFDVDRVVVIGRARITTPALQSLAGQGIPACFLTRSGRWIGGFYPTTNGHALRRLRQYEIARNAEPALTIARALVAAKVRNSRRVLQRLAANRSLSKEPGQMGVCNSLLATLHKAEQAAKRDALRGYEGIAAALYFKRLAAFFPENIPFKSRSRRPPRDPANALLSWTYSIVLSEIDGAVRSAGLDPCLGFLHDISYGRPSLSVDLLEPLRPPLCDMLVLHLLNHGILTKDNFEYNAEDGGTYLTRNARKDFFIEYERTMTRRFAATKNAAHTDFRAVIRESVNAVLRALEGREEPAFFQMP